MYWPNELFASKEVTQMKCRCIDEQSRLETKKPNVYSSLLLIQFHYFISFCIPNNLFEFRKD